MKTSICREITGLLAVGAALPVLGLFLLLALGLLCPTAAQAAPSTQDTGNAELKKTVQAQQARSARLLDIVSNPQKITLRSPKPQPGKATASGDKGGSKGGSKAGGNNSNSGDLIGVININTTKDKANTGTSLGHAICQTARTQVGKPYRAGGVSPNTGFDCSGLIYWSFAQHGVKMPRTAKEQSFYGAKIERSQLRPGDIVVFKLPSTYHSGIYLGNDKFIHSPSSGKTIREDSVSSTYWSKYYISGRRVIN